MPAYYRFKLGDFTCISLSDGGMNYPVSAFFKGMPLDQAEAILRQQQLPTTHVYTPYTLLYIDTGAHKVLVDTGVGRIGKHVQAMWPQVDNSGLEPGILLKSLQQAGIRPEEIDTVIITHAHPDHIGGTLNEENNLNMPNAHYFIAQVEWDFWFSDERTAKVPPSFVSTARENLAPLRDCMTCIGPEAQIVPGITAIETFGHTPGHLALSVVSRKDELLHLSDAVIHPIHLRYPELLLPYDLLPEQTLASKRRMCERAAGGGALVFAHHFPPYPNLGHIVRTRECWSWQPFAAAMP